MLHSAPRGSLCAEAFRAIEADLEAFSPGRAAAHDGHGCTAGERAVLTIMYISTYYSCNKPAVPFGFAFRFRRFRHAL